MKEDNEVQGQGVSEAGSECNKVSPEEAGPGEKLERQPEETVA